MKNLVIILLGCLCLTSCSFFYPKKEVVLPEETTKLEAIPLIKVEDVVEETVVTKEEYIGQLDDKIEILKELKQNYFELHRRMYDYVTKIEGYYVFSKTTNLNCNLPVSTKAVEVRLTREVCDESSLNSSFDELYRLGNIFSGTPRKNIVPTRSGIKFKKFKYKSFLIIDENGKYSKPHDLEVIERFDNDSILQWHKVTNITIVHGKLAERINDLKQIGISQGINSKAYKKHKLKIAILRNNIKQTRDGLPMVRTQTTDIDQAIEEAILEKPLAHMTGEKTLKSLDNVIEESQSLYTGFIKSLRQ